MLYSDNTLLSETFFFSYFMCRFFYVFLFINFVFVPLLPVPVFNLFLCRITELERFEFLNVKRISFTSGSYHFVFVKLVNITLSTNQSAVLRWLKRWVNQFSITHQPCFVFSLSTFLLYYCALYYVLLFKMSYLLTLDIFFFLILWH